MDNLTKLNIDKNFGKIFREYRIKSGFTQEQLAEKLDISLKYISRLENGYNGIKTQTLIKTFNILGITPDILYKNFITNSEVKKNVELSEKINLLSEEKKDALSKIIDLLQNL